MSIRTDLRFRFAGVAAAFVFAAALSVAGPARAGMNGQPKLSAGDAAQARKLSAEIVRRGGDAGRARPALMTLVETNATADLTADVASALRDENTYTGLLATFEDAFQAQTKAADRTFVRYNILRTHLFRARILPNPSRGPVLAAAARNAEAVDKAERDPALWEVVGDIYAEKGDVASALAAYKRMQTGGAPASVMHYKTGYANHRAGRLAPARQSYEAGVKADLGSSTGGGQTLHLLFQGLASLALQEGKPREAVDALLRSGDVKQDPANPFRLQLALAYLLLERGYAKEVKAYADNAVKLFPDDVDAKALRDAAEEKL